MSRREKNKDKKTNSKRVILTIFELFFFMVMLYSGWKIICWGLDNGNNKKVIKELSQSITITKSEDNPEETEHYEINFEELKNKNSDTVGYLKLNGIDIEYIVVKSTDNEYYLSHSFDKSYNGAGWIFADFRNKVDGTDKNLVIYGHNRRDGSMFGSMKNALTEEWYSNEDNRKILFITENEKSTYEVFSIYKIPVEDYYITTDFTDQQYDKFLETIKNRSIKDFNVQLNTNDKILTLSTCDNNNQYRVVVHARKVIENEEINNE